MKVKVQFTIGVDPEDFRKEYAEPDMPLDYIRQMIQGHAEVSTEAWLQDAGCWKNWA